MTPARCQHAGLVEALSDGRLGAPERQSVERHVATCAACAAWLRDLDAIRQAIRAPVAAPTPLQHQRARLAVLRGAVEEGEPRRPRHRRAWGVVAVALVAGSAWATTVALRGAPLPAAPLATTGSPTASPAAKAATPRGAAAATATTSDPEPVAPTPPGTAAAPIATSAPHPFGSSASATITPEATGPVRRAPLAPAVQGSSAAPAASAPAAPAPAAPAPAASAPTPPSASHDFAEAMSALESGDFARAAARFEAFTGAHPFDPRSDEAAYLIAIALERAGRTAEARAAARRYLQSRPRGAHRAQAERMLGAQAP